MEAPVGPIGRLRQRDGLVGARDRLGELAELGQAPPEEGARVHGLSGSNAPSVQLFLERHDVPAEQRGAATVVADPVQHLAEIEVCRLLETGVGHGSRDLAALLTRLDRARGIAGQKKAVSPVDEHPPEPGPIAESFGLRFRLAQLPKHTLMIPERHARLTEVEAKSDRPRDGVRREWEMPERVERLLEAGDGLAVRRPLCGVASGLREVAVRKLPDLGGVIVAAEG